MMEYVVFLQQKVNTVTFTWPEHKFMPKFNKELYAKVKLWMCKLQKNSNPFPCCFLECRLLRHICILLGSPKLAPRKPGDHAFGNHQLKEEWVALLFCCHGTRKIIGMFPHMVAFRSCVMLGLQPEQRYQFPS